MTRRKIESLTPEQEAELPIFRQRYLDIATGGGRIDRPALESALADAYAEIGKPAPRLFIFDSPAECMLALKIFQMPADQTRDNLRVNLRDNLWANLRDNLGANLGANLRDNLWANLGANLGDNLRANLWANLRDNLRDNLWDNLGDNLWANLRDNLGDNLGANLRDNLWANLGANLRDNLWANLGDNLWDNLRANLWANLRDNLGDNLRVNLWANLRDNLRVNLRDNLGDNLGDQKIWNPNFLWGSQDLYWIAWARFAEKIGCEFAPNDARRLDIMERISTQCEWWWPYENIVVVSQRPLVKWDGEGRMHCETGPAVEYRGGYGLHMWRGTMIPAEWIGDGPPPANEIMRLENTEQRRVACEIRGWHNILPELDGARLIDRHSNPQVGELWEANLPDHGRECFLKVECGTGRTFAMPVGPKFKTAREANAATYGIAPQILDNLQFRT